MLTYIFRKPKYPIICTISGHVIAAKSEKSFMKILDDVALDPEKSYDLIDATAEGWSFMPGHLMISPITFRKQWSKKELIALYNGRTNQSPEGVPYSEKSLSSKRFERIFGDLVELLLKKPGKPLDKMSQATITSV
jgi:hypothetical protein